MIFSRGELGQNGKDASRVEKLDEEHIFHYSELRRVGGLTTSYQAEESRPVLGGLLWVWDLEGVCYEKM